MLTPSPSSNAVVLPPELVLTSVLTPGRSFVAGDRATGEELVIRRCGGSRRQIERRLAAFLETRPIPGVVLERRLISHDGQLFSARPWVPGRPFGATRGDSVGDLDTALLRFCTIAAVVERLHEAGLAHGRLHGHNVVLEEQTVMLVDAFDASPVTPGSATTTAEVGLSPQRLNGRAPERSDDLHGLGVLLFELLTGRHPFAGVNATDGLRRALYDTAIFSASEERALPAKLKALTLALLDRSPARRPGSVGEVLRELDASAHPADAGATITRPPSVASASPPVELATIVMSGASDRTPRPSGTEDPTSAERESPPVELATTVISGASDRTLRPTEPEDPASAAAAVPPALTSPGERAPAVVPEPIASGLPSILGAKGDHRGSGLTPDSSRAAIEPSSGLSKTTEGEITEHPPGQATLTPEMEKGSPADLSAASRLAAAALAALPVASWPPSSGRPFAESGGDSFGLHPSAPSATATADPIKHRGTTNPFLRARPRQLVTPHDIPGRRWAIRGAVVAAVLVGWTAVGALRVDPLEREVAELLADKQVDLAKQRIAAEARDREKDDVVVEKLRGDVACAGGEYDACLRSYLEVLQAAPKYADDETMRQNTLALLEREDRKWLAAFVASQLDGVDDELTAGTESDHYWRRWASVRALEARGDRDEVNYAVVYSLDVLNAGSCNTRRRALAKVVELGDPAALPNLEKAQETTGKKLFGDFCLGDELSEAIHRLQSQDPL